MVIGYYYPTLSYSFLVHFLWNYFCVYFYLFIIWRHQHFSSEYLRSVIFDNALANATVHWVYSFFLRMWQNQACWVHIMFQSTINTSQCHTEAENPDCIYKTESPLSRCKSEWAEQWKHEHKGMFRWPMIWVTAWLLTLQGESQRRKPSCDFPYIHDITIMVVKEFSKHTTRFLSLSPHIIWKRGINIFLMVSKLVVEISFVKGFKESKSL